MPQASQILGVNSVTNIELDKGVLPAPIIRNADWFEKFDRAISLSAFSARRKASERRNNALDHCSLPLQNSGKWPIY
ncbi:hypothetical protein B0D71_28350 [Pseudomonas laurylsulfativorans]|uniref:Uncharacterized protein n=1 Tax=Pseudomonas laurylsulfativorans TaxID=1943631 RepID=A0A2S3VGC0_9PSED|nr:hypothetical protein B0D71_28350 [Pseudomonas laurylsulfativorans]